MKTHTLTAAALALATVLTPLAVFAEEGGAPPQGAAPTRVLFRAGEADTRGVMMGSTTGSQPPRRDGGPAFDGEDRPRAQGSTTGMMPQRMEGAPRGMSSTSRMDSRMEKMQGRGEMEIDVRLKSLEKLGARIDEARNLTQEQKAALVGGIVAQKESLNELKDAIAKDTSSTTLKDDVRSVVQSQRTYRLVIPKTAITAASDRITTIVTQMQVLGTKINARISAAKADGKDTTQAEATYADFTAKILDAKVQADAAVALVANLSADNGDATISASNTQALKDAKAKIEAAQADLKAARAAIGKLTKRIQGQKGSDGSVSVTASTSVSAQ